MPGTNPTSGGSHLDALLRPALREFALDVWGRNWLSKERDCVNRFAHRHLAARIRSGTVFYDLAQMRIEGGVPQPPGVGTKPGLYKDLVIWADPDATCFEDKRGDGRWVPRHTPLAVVEWKAELRGRARPRLCAHDLAWLGAAARHWPGFVGYAVLLHRDVLMAARCEKDTVDLEWLRQPRAS